MPTIHLELTEREARSLAVALQEARGQAEWDWAVMQYVHPEVEDTTELEFVDVLQKLEAQL